MPISIVLSLLIAVALNRRIRVVRIYRIGRVRARLLSTIATAIMFLAA